MIFITADTFVVRVGYAVAQMPISSVAYIGQLVWGVIVAQVLAMTMPQFWYGEIEEKPSPAEASLESNLIYRLMPLVMVFAFILLIGIGLLSGGWQQTPVVVQMKNVAEASAASIPFSLETGQNLIVQLSEDPRMLVTDNPELLQVT